uniref:Uncharacterized protein n=1 Tax=Anopheles marajoara TaxID=58244 RepID=A0A2M4C1L6_9DIPT
MAIDLLRLPVLLQQTAQHTHAVHPQQLLGHTGVRRTLPLAISTVTTLAAGDRVLADAIARVHHHRLLDDQTILDQFADVLAGVGVSDLVNFIRIQPHLLFAASHHRGCQPLLQLKGTESKTNIRSDEHLPLLDGRLRHPRTPSIMPPLSPSTPSPRIPPVQNAEESTNAHIEPHT